MRTVSLRIDLERMASLRRAPERTFPDRFFPVKSQFRRSRILSDTAFACNHSHCLNDTELPLTFSCGIQVSCSNAHEADSVAHMHANQ